VTQTVTANAVLPKKAAAAKTVLSLVAAAVLNASAAGRLALKRGHVNVVVPMRNLVLAAVRNLALAGMNAFVNAAPGKLRILDFKIC